MAATTSPERVHEITDWIERQARAMNIPVSVYPDGLSRNGDWLHVPVGVAPDFGDAYDRASALQQIEDVWNQAPPLPGVSILLVPAKHNPATRQEQYGRLGEILARQHRLLDEFRVSDITPDNAARFQAIRQEWEETLNELGRMFPSAKEGTVVS